LHPTSTASTRRQVEAQRKSRGEEALVGLLRRLNPEPGTGWDEVRLILCMH